MDFLLKMLCSMPLSLIQESEASDVLVGGVDEITDTSHTILSRFGLYKNDSVSGNDIYTINIKRNHCRRRGRVFSFVK